MSKPKPRRNKRRRPEPATFPVEVDVVEGLEAIARQEIIVTLGQRASLPRPSRRNPEAGLIRFTYTGGLRALLRLQTVQAVHAVYQFDVPRPRALLGDEHLRALLRIIEGVRAVHPPDAFQTLYIGAAGSDSPVMERLKETLAARMGMTVNPEEGDLLLRLRRPPRGEGGWQVVVRLSPRPLATRPWRVCNMEGALNATVAHAMTLMTAPRPHDVFLNLACGSGTLLIERLLGGPARRAIGCDTSPEALACGQENVRAAGLASTATLHDWDARSLPLEEASVDAITADLPFGHQVGSHEQNVHLYPDVLQEAARVARPGTLFSLITHEVHLMESLLRESTQWRVEGVQRVTLSGLHPRIFVLRRV